MKLRIDGEEQIVSTKRCSKCVQPVQDYATVAKTGKQLEKEEEEEEKRVEEILGSLKPREQKAIQRKIATGEIEYDAKRDCLIYGESQEQFNMGDSDSDDDDEDSDDGSIESD